MFLALPALLFLATAEADPAAFGGGGFALCVSAALLVTFVVSLALSPRDRPLADRAIEALASAYPNTGFMGIPLVSAVFGTRALPLAIVAALLTVCALFAVAIVLVEVALGREGARAGKGSPARVVGVLARNPIVLAPIAGVLWNGTIRTVPPPIRHLATLLGDAATPVALVTIGVVLAERRGGADEASPVATAFRVTALKLVFQPLLTSALAILVFHLAPLERRCAVLLMALPIGTGPFMLAKLYDREEGATGRAVLLSTVLSLATVPAVIALLTA